MSNDACCEMMRFQLDASCPDHPNPMDCPDAVVVRWADGQTILPVRDGEHGDASSGIIINFCPWCARELPMSDPELIKPL